MACTTIIPVRYSSVPYPWIVKYCNVVTIFRDAIVLCSSVPHTGIHWNIYNLYLDSSAVMTALTPFKLRRFEAETFLSRKHSQRAAQLLRSTAP